MSTSIYTGLNPFIFIRKHVLQICKCDVSYERSHCSFYLIKRAWAITIHDTPLLRTVTSVHRDFPNARFNLTLRRLTTYIYVVPHR
jgi:hypothetical protein